MTLWKEGDIQGYGLPGLPHAHFNAWSLLLAACPNQWRAEIVCFGCTRLWWTYAPTAECPHLRHTCLFTSTARMCTAEVYFSLSLILAGCCQRAICTLVPKYACFFFFFTLYRRMHPCAWDLKEQLWASSGQASIYMFLAVNSPFTGAFRLSIFHLCRSMKNGQQCFAMGKQI